MIDDVLINIECSFDVLNLKLEIVLDRSRFWMVLFRWNICPRFRQISVASIPCFVNSCSRLGREPPSDNLALWLFVSRQLTTFVSDLISFKISFQTVLAIDCSSDKTSSVIFGWLAFYSLQWATISIVRLLNVSTSVQIFFKSSMRSLVKAST